MKETVSNLEKLSSEKRESFRGSNRVKRGGSWNNSNTDNLRASNRNNNSPGNNNNNGFRCASTIKNSSLFFKEGKADLLLSRKISCTGENLSKRHLFPIFVALSKISGIKFSKKVLFLLLLSEVKNDSANT